MIDFLKATPIEIAVWLDKEEELDRKKIANIRRTATKIRTEILERDDYTCRQCGKNGRNYPTEMEVDHIKPVSKGGTSDRSNLQTLCQHCNRKKHSTYNE